MIVDLLDNAVDLIATATGRPTDHIRLFVGLITMLPVGMIMNLFVTEGKVTRHLYSTVMGVLIQIFMFRWSVYHIYLMAAGAYVIMAFAPRKT